ncbi:sensor histidine kinase [Microbacterium sp. BH-3-3-3]|uniref:sensor histidine kinase n=1 Tax=Microbacterium sp. BH-3-3-3 TaxID=1906742 RepID=UPI000B0CA25A|nr:histidine kinase [Microbacterium sp. BH-3-3-3]
MTPAPRYGLPITRRDQRIDLAIAGLILIGTLVSTWLTAASSAVDPRPTLPLATAYAVVLATALSVRRRWPATVAVIVAAAYFSAISAGLPEVWVGNIAVFTAFYTVGAYSPDRRRAHAARIVIIVGMAVWFFVALVLGSIAGGVTATGIAATALTVLMLLVNVLFFAGGYYFGERTHAQLRQRRALEERTAELEREREHSAAQAVALERVRIARELHDVVAHHVSLMGVQAGVARSVMGRDAEKARDVLTGVEESARTSLRELRQLLETLRTPGLEGESTDTAPTTHGLSSIAALVEEASSAGLPTTFTMVGAAVADPPPLMQVNLYRIAQEALTNARRHAGPGATADVRLRFDPGAVELEVANTGRRGSTATGLGQLGMRERAAASGGTIEIGPRARGGYLVRVRVPMTPTEVSHA